MVLQVTVVLSRGRRVQRAFRRADAVRDVLAFAFGSDTREDEGQAQGAAFDLVMEGARLDPDLPLGDVPDRTLLRRVPREAL